MPDPSAAIVESYKAHLAGGELKPDAAQDSAVKVLQSFADELGHHHKNFEQRGKGFSAYLRHTVFGSPLPKSYATADGKYGLYIFGQVGRGKSMLMDLFMEHIDIPKKRRVHFHQFMLEIHDRLSQLRHKGETDDIMHHLVDDIAEEISLLCFDEFHVSNIADAMILGRLFSGLFEAGVIIVSTSNWAPDELYKNGLQRDRFLPFIELIKDRMLIHEMKGGIDYRYEQLRNLKSYFTPLGLETTRKLQGIFFELTHEATPELITLLVDGRELKISNAAQGTGFFNFDELCKAALGAADYLAIAKCLHTVILDGVPLLKAEQRNEAVRFMTLIDTLYEAKVKFFMASELPFEKLAPVNDLAVPFQRTISRLMEMQSESYRLKAHMGEGA